MTSIPLSSRKERKEFTVGSLFAGIGGFDLGFERAGFKTSWQVEINPYCQKVLAKNFPEAERFGDIRECGSHNLKPVDVICGGFPCQDISNAGLRVGIEGEQSGLWKHYARIICELRPRFVVVENVAALLGRGMGVVLGDLAEIGYDAEWEIISAADAGAPHLRERVWIVSYPFGQRYGRSPAFAYAGYDQERHLETSKRGGGRSIVGKAVADSEALAHSDRSRRQEQDTATVTVTEGFDTGRDDSARDEDVADAGEQQRNRWSDWTCGWGREPQEALRDARGRGRQEAWMSIPESRLGRVAYGVPAVVDRLRGLGNAVVPQIPEMYAMRIREALERLD